MNDENHDQANHPQDITDVEKALGFEHALLAAYGLPNEKAQPFSNAPVVMKVLSPSDVLVKILFFGKIAYSHKRFGVDKQSSSKLPEWWPINVPDINAGNVIANFQKGITSATYIQHIVPANFNYAPAL